ncbi:MAG: hypothetical protein L6V95_04040 [Candidatus Melainabacteria bacterium]|nr:MAG: hypothetical protein L6V95_04040 [Candidatus Melainabacteria bacterium]
MAKNLLTWMFRMVKMRKNQVMMLHLWQKAKYHLCTFLSDTVGVMKPYEAQVEDDKTENDDDDDETKKVKA